MQALERLSAYSESADIKNRGIISGMIADMANAHQGVMQTYQDTAADLVKERMMP